jgi:hypothetical protein
MKKAVYVVLMICFLWLLSFLIYSVLSIVNSSPTQVYLAIIGVLCALWWYGLGEYWWAYIYENKNRKK